MGNWNCTSGARKKTKAEGNKGQAENDTDEKEEMSSAEDVTYTTVDHGSKTPAVVIRDSQDDCDYAIVNIPSKQNSRRETKTSTADDSGDETDEYVLMQ